VWQSDLGIIRTRIRNSFRLFESRKWNTQFKWTGWSEWWNSGWFGKYTQWFQKQFRTDQEWNDQFEFEKLENECLHIEP